MVPLTRIILVTTLIAGGSSGLLVLGKLSPWWLVLILPASLCIGLYGAMTDEH